MGLGTDLSTWLRTRPLLTALLDTDDKAAARIHPRYLPQDAGTRPRAIVFHKISDVSEGSLAGVVQMSHARLQFDCFGRTPEEADGIRDRLKKELDGFFRGTMNTVRVLGLLHDSDRDQTDLPIDGSDQPRFVCMCDYQMTYQRITE